MTRIITALLAISACSAAPAMAQQDYQAAFAFSETKPDGTPAGWNSGPAGTVALDSTTTRSGPYAARLVRNATSPGQFSVLNMSIPVTFTGDTIELRGWLRTEDVEEFGGLFLRLDGAGSQLQIDNMQDRGPSGTTEWTEYRIRLPFDDDARTIVMGALMPGAGTLWVDDIQLLVDGRPFSEAPQRQLSGAERDHEFDDGSGIATQPLSDMQISNLALLGMVWGFAKYHHPAIVAGDVNWDYELFRVMPAVLGAGDREAASNAITAWLDRLGEPAPCDPCAVVPDDAHLLPDLGWISDPAPGESLRVKLQTIHANRSVAPDQYYRGMAPNVGNPVFSNEVGYASPVVPDAGFRLLGLFRFWNIVQYWFPYRDVIGEDWDAVLSEFLPLVMGADNTVEYTLIMMQLSARINDTHANIWLSLALRPPTGDAQLPVLVRFIEDRPVVSGYTHAELGPASGLQRGDVIERLDGMPVDSLIAVWRPYYSASNEPTRLRDIGRFMTQGEAGPGTVTVRRGEETQELMVNRVATRDLDMSRVAINDLPGETFQRISDEVAYLKLSSVKNADMDDYMRRAAGAEVLVVDIRNYPSEFAVFTLGGRLVNEPTPFAKFTTGDPSNPGAFVWRQPVVIRPLEPGFSGKVVILVDETSLSQAEYTAMALRASPNAIVVGSTTAGADGNVSQVPLPGGIISMISGIGVFYPDGTPTQRIGIIPDLEVRPTIEGIRDGRDEVLESGVSHALGREFRLPPR